MASSDGEQETPEETPATNIVPIITRSGVRRAQEAVDAEPPADEMGEHTMERLKRMLDESHHENERLREQRQRTSEPLAAAGEGAHQTPASGNTQVTTTPPLDVSKVLKHARHVRKLDCLHRSPTVWAEFYGENQDSLPLVPLPRGMPCTNRHDFQRNDRLRGESRPVHPTSSDNHRPRTSNRDRTRTLNGPRPHAVRRKRSQRTKRRGTTLYHRRPVLSSERSGRSLSINIITRRPSCNNPDLHNQRKDDSKPIRHPYQR